MDKPCLITWYAERKTALADAVGNSVPGETPSEAKAADAPASTTDAKTLDEKYGPDATSACSVEADDYLRSISKYDFKWDEMGFFDFKFDKYMRQTIAPGVLTLSSEKAKLQNGFGAYERIELLCDFDTQAKKIIRFRINPAT